MDKKYISVFVPVYNGEKYLSECIRAILEQELPAGYSLELLVTDSGSKDNSAEIAKSFGNRIIFNEIPNVDFGHGKTRRWAAEKAIGEYILFTTQDATPSDRWWIINMIEPFLVSNKIGCVFGRQTPRPYAVPTIKREVSGVFDTFGPGNAIMLHNKKSLWGDRAHDNYNYFFSDVNSALRKDLVKIVPFRDVRYSEDMALAEDMEAAGYIKAYSPRGNVWHSNEYTVREYRKRKFDEFVGLRESVGITHSSSIKSLLLGWVRPTIRDWLFVYRDQEYNLRSKLKYIPISVAYNLAGGLGRYEALKYGDDVSKRKSLSLEESRKK